MIRAVLFDIDGVLLDSFEANLKFFQDLLESEGYPRPTREQYRTVFHLPLIDTIRTLTHSGPEDVIQRIWEKGRSADFPYPFDQLTMPDGTEQVIQQLHKLYLLGIVTSRIREDVYEFPRFSRLRPFFHLAISYQDTVHHKPHPEPLLLAAHQLNIQPAECVYIGDAKTDEEAAIAAGMKFILFGGKPLHPKQTSTGSFRALPDLIARFTP